MRTPCSDEPMAFNSDPCHHSILEPSPCFSRILTEESTTSGLGYPENLPWIATLHHRVPDSRPALHLAGDEGRRDGGFAAGAMWSMLKPGQNQRATATTRTQNPYQSLSVCLLGATKRIIGRIVLCNQGKWCRQRPSLCISLPSMDAAGSCLTHGHSNRGLGYSFGSRSCST